MTSVFLVPTENVYQWFGLVCNVEFVNSVMNITIKLL